MCINCAFNGVPFLVPCSLIVAGHFHFRVWSLQVQRKCNNEVIYMLKIWVKGFRSDCIKNPGAYIFIQRVMPSLIKPPFKGEAFCFFSTQSVKAYNIVQNNERFVILTNILFTVIIDIVTWRYLKCIADKGNLQYTEFSCKVSDWIFFMVTSPVLKNKY